MQNANLRVNANITSDTSLVNEIPKADLGNLGLSTLGGQSADILPFIYKRQYFITINLSVNSKVYAVHNNVYGIFFWYNLTQCEQHKFFKYILHKFSKNHEVQYKVCFEQTKTEEIHIHFICDTNLSQKSIRTIFFDLIYNGVKTQLNIRTIMKYFIDIKIFDKNRWNDYFNKYSKTYQTTQFSILEYIRKSE